MKSLEKLGSTRQQLVSKSVVVIAHAVDLDRFIGHCTVCTIGSVSVCQFFEASTDDTGHMKREYFLTIFPYLLSGIVLVPFHILLILRASSCHVSLYGILPL